MAGSLRLGPEHVSRIALGSFATRHYRVVHSGQLCSYRRQTVERIDLATKSTFERPILSQA